MIVCRPVSGDAVHAHLKRAVEQRQISYLWVPGDTPPFKPALLPIIYGDGRALFGLATINQRPRYWVIRGCSTWGSSLDLENAAGPDFAELADDILTDLEEEFGNGRCGYSNNSLFQPRRERVKWCQCEDCSDTLVARWPMVDGSGGCSWSRMDWPRGFPTAPNPLSWQGNLLAIENSSI
jgi:hypothetical protein